MTLSFGLTRYRQSWRLPTDGNKFLFIWRALGLGSSTSYVNLSIPTWNCSFKPFKPSKPRALRSQFISIHQQESAASFFRNWEKRRLPSAVRSGVTEVVSSNPHRSFFTEQAAFVCRLPSAVFDGQEQGRAIASFYAISKPLDRSSLHRSSFSSSTPSLDLAHHQQH